MKIPDATRRMLHLLLAVLVLGTAIGVASGLLSLLLIWVERISMGYAERMAMPGPFQVPVLRRVLSVVLGAMFAGVIWWLLRTRTIPVPSVKKAVDGVAMPWWQTTVHVLLQILIVGSGSSIGREAAPREFGAMLGQYYSRAMKFNGADLRTIVAVCAGAGLAGVYEAPLAGLFFAIEILLVDVTIEKVAVAFGMSVIASYIASVIKGSSDFYQLEGLQSAVTPSLMVFALIAGVVCAFAGAWFRTGVKWAQSGSRNDVTMIWRMPLAASVTGLLSIGLPQVMGNGRAAAQLSFDTALIMRLLPWAFHLTGGETGTAVATFGLLMILVLTLCAKTVATLLTIRAGASGGVLQPGIVLGSVVGAILGIGWIMLFPADSLSACALIGAAALLSASQQAPLMATCLVMELCGAPMHFVIPVGVAVTVSSLISSRLEAATSRGLSRSQRK